MVQLVSEQLSARPQTHSTWWSYLQIFVLVIVFLFALQLISSGFLALKESTLEQLVDATSKPFIGLFIGLLITALIQSSSTVTSLSVLAVSAGTLSLNSAVPIIMGANIGTTVTSTIIALGHLDSRRQYRKAISSSVLHDTFNIITVAVLLPLELQTGWLTQASSYISSSIVELFGISQANEAVSSSGVFSATSNLLLKYIQPVWVLAAGTVILVVALKAVAKAFRMLFINSSRQPESWFFSSHNKALLSGTLATMIVQSSSVTTSFIVPVVANGRISVKRSFAFIVGANIGTTFTAFIAALTKSELALTCALVHVGFNLFGFFLLYVFKPARAIPVYLARKLGQYSIRNWLIGFFYLLLLFFVLPFLLILLS